MGVLTDLPKPITPDQYPRVCKLLVANLAGDAFDLSELRIKFTVKRSDTMTPNVADIRVYNVEKQTALKIFSELSPVANSASIQRDRGQVILQAGYEGNYGVIFQGSIKQIIIGRESGTETYIDIIAGDGVRAYNYAIVNSTLAAGATPSDQVLAAVTSMAEKSVTQGHIGKMPDTKLTRGKVLYGNARKYLRDIALSTQQTWSIQDEKVTFIPITSYLPGESVVLTSKTGLIGTPQQTNEGVNVRCLLNPKIRIGGLININEAEVADFKINLSSPNSAANIAPPLQADGNYYCLVVEHQGDTRGVDWYTTITGIISDLTTNPINGVQVGYGL